jgi:hypothetical protein
MPNPEIIIPVIDNPIMNYDPVVGFLEMAQRSAIPSPELVREGQTFIESASTFLQKNPQTRDVVAGQKIRLQGGALEWDIKEGHAFTWLEGTYSVDPSGNLALEDIRLVAVNYQPIPLQPLRRTDLFVGTPGEPLRSGITGFANQQDINYCTALLRRMSAASKA